jgi:hypothetical protein
MATAMAEHGSLVTMATSIVDDAVSITAVSNFDANRATAASLADDRWSPRQQPLTEQTEASDGQYNRVAEAGKGISSSCDKGDSPMHQRARIERPKSAWKSNHRRPNFTDEQIVSDSLEAEIDTLILEDDGSIATPKMPAAEQDVVNNDRRAADDGGGNRQQTASPKSVNHDGPTAPGQLHDKAGASGRHEPADSDDWLPSKLNPRTPRAWQAREDAVAGGAASSSLQLELQIALPDETDVELPALDSNGAQQQRRRRSSDVVTTPTDSWSSGERPALIGSDEWTNGKPTTAMARTGVSESDHFKSNVVENIRRKAFERYNRQGVQQQQQQQHAVPVSASAYYAKQARYGPSSPPRNTTMAAANALGDEAVNATSSDFESRIPVPIGKLTPIVKSVKSRDLNVKSDKKRRLKKDKKQEATIPFAESSFKSTVGDGSAPYQSSPTGGRRKYKLKPLMGHRARALMNEIQSSPTVETHDTMAATAHGVDRGTTFTFPSVAAESASDEQNGSSSQAVFGPATTHDYSRRQMPPGSTAVLQLPINDVPDSTSAVVESEPGARHVISSSFYVHSENGSLPTPAASSTVAGWRLSDDAFNKVPMTATFPPPYRPVPPNRDHVVHVASRVAVNADGNEQNQQGARNNRLRAAGDGLGNNNEFKTAFGSLLSDDYAATSLVNPLSMPYDVNLEEFSLFAPHRQRHLTHSNGKSSTSVAHQSLQERLSDPVAAAKSRKQPFVSAATSAPVTGVNKTTTAAAAVATTTKSVPAMPMVKTGPQTIDDRPGLATGEWNGSRGQFRPPDGDSTAMPFEPTASVGSALHPVAPTAAWGLSLTDMWKQLQSTSKLDTTSTEDPQKIGNGQRFPSYMR